ncbi:MAG: transcriptional regulator [Bradyrhizobium sp.]|nr:transcriptional regulator [Bradyrhizobium sp.]
MATRLFWRGYDRTSLSDLTAAMGIAPASFYFAFGSKETLFREIVDHYVALWAEAFDRGFEAKTTVAGVEAILFQYADFVTNPVHAPGCVVINSMPAANDDDPLRRWLTGHRDGIRARFEEQFSQAVASGEWPEDADPKVMTRLVMTLMGGIAVEARSGASRAELYEMIAVALRGLPAARGVQHGAVRGRV